MCTFFKRFNLALFSVVVAATCLLGGIAAAEIRFAILPRMSPTELYAMFKPLEEYLTTEVGEKVSIVTSKDFTAYKDMVKGGQADIGFANPLIYVELKNDINIEPIALSEEFKAGSKFRGIIIARKDSSISTIQDLKGKRISFVDKDSAAGYIFQMLTLSKAGLDIKKDFITLPFAKKHDNVTIAVFNGSADAGGIREDDLDKMKDKVNLSQLKIVAYTDYFPNWPVFVTPGMNKDTAAKVKKALLKLKPKSPEAAKILGKARLDGFISVKDKDYDELRKAVKLLGGQ